MPNACPFCEPEKHRIWFYNDIGFVLWDAYPVSDGHALVVPKKHVASLYDLTQETQAALWRLVSETRRRLVEKEKGPDGFNIGVNDGVAAGQTVIHSHIHVIPRWNNDVPDPRGGVRWVIPEKARYWGDE
jgi:diadenosine tetraphosphate (Ap4A) HIT family hydrolase